MAVGITYTNSQPSSNNSIFLATGYISKASDEFPGKLR